MTATVWTASGVLLAGAVTFIPVAPCAGAQVAIKRGPAGFNLFSVQQDIEIGSRAAVEIGRQVTLVTSPRTTHFLGNVTAVVAQASRAKFPIQVRAINSGDVNLLVLPGGQIFVTRGLLSHAKSEAEVAAVLAHAMAHVVLRHGTARTSRAYLSKAGLSALGRLGKSGSVEGIVNTVGGFGMNAAFLAFARSDEYEADALGAEFLSSAGYDPVTMATVFATLRREKARLPGIQRFHAAHPPAADREIRIRNLCNVLRHGRAEIVGGFNRIRWHGAATSAAAAAPEVKTSTGTVEIRTTVAIPDIPAPSPEFTRFTDPDAVVTIDHPSNWDTYQSGAAMSFVPAGGVVEREDGAPSLVQGVIVNQYEPFEDDVERWNNSMTRHYAPFQDRSRPRGALEDATDDLVRQIMSASTWLTAPPRSARAEVVDGLRGYSVRLSGRSPITGKTERVTLYTRALPDDHIIYMACVAAGRAVSSVERACNRMVQSLRINDSSLHRQQRH
jgi:hypothetical protein